MATVFGLDISHHQGSFDIGRAAREGCEFFILKATEGNGFTDSRFAENLRNTRAAGKLVAAYHYQRSNVSAASQVAHIQRVVPKDVPVIPDVEHNSGGVDITRDIVARLRAAGYKVPLLYLPRWYWQQIGSPGLSGLPPLWSSRYPDNRVGSIPSEYAQVPAHYWNGYGGLDVAVLQFTSSASVAGRSPIDANAYRGSVAQLGSLFGAAGGGGAPAPITDDERLEAGMALSNEALKQIHDAVVHGTPGAKLIHNRRLNRGEWLESSLGSLEQRVIDQHIRPLRAQVDALSAGGVDEDAIAAKVAAQVSEGIAKAVADEVYRRLSS